MVKMVMEKNKHPKIIVYKDVLVLYDYRLGTTIIRLVHFPARSYPFHS